MTNQIYSRQFLMQMIQEAGRMTNQQLECPKCLDCDNWDNGHCKQWQQIVPVEAWAAGCDSYQPWMPF